MTTYYVSNVGGNDDPGTESQPWQTVGKVQGFGLSAGDSVYFNRGDTWNEDWAPQEDGSSGNPITYGAYGSGAKPIIDYTTGIEAEAVLWLSGRNYLTFENLNITTTLDGLNYCLSTSQGNACTNIIFTDCDFYGGDQGCLIGAASDGLQMTGGTVDGVGQDGITSFGPNCVYDGITVTDWGRTVNDRAGIKIYGGASADSIVRNCIVHNASQNNDYLNGIENDLGDVNSGTLIEYNTVYDTPIGIHIYRGGSCTVRYNLVYDIEKRTAGDNSAIIVSGADAEDNFVYNNTVYSCHIGLEIGNALRTTAKNNIFVECSAYLIVVYGNDYATHTLDYNLHYNAGADEWQWGAATPDTWADFKTESGQEANGLNADPLFTSAAGDDYTLQDTSPCINVGVPLGLTRDFAGNFVFFGNAPDIGAYETSRGGVLVTTTLSEEISVLGYPGAIKIDIGPTSSRKLRIAETPPIRNYRGADASILRGDEVVKDFKPGRPVSEVHDQTVHGQIVHDQTSCVICQIQNMFTQRRRMRK